jgi:hypothetical protein
MDWRPWFWNETTLTFDHPMGAWQAPQRVPENNDGSFTLLTPLKFGASQGIELSNYQIWIQYAWWNGRDSSGHDLGWDIASAQRTLLYDDGHGLPDRADCVLSIYTTDPSRCHDIPYLDCPTSTAAARTESTLETLAQSTDRSPELASQSRGVRSVSCGGVRATIVGTPGDDTISGTIRKDVIAGLGGNDTILGRQGSDVICAGRGNDQVDGGPGNDVELGGSGADAELGHRGEDILIGEAGDDALSGGPGSDAFEAGPGRDLIVGGVGFDVLSYQFAPTGVQVDLATRGSQGGEGQDRFSGIDGLIGSEHGDRLLGTDHTDDFLPLAGNDTVDGSSGYDILEYGAANQRVALSLTTHHASGEGHDTIYNTEIVVGTNYDDILVGSPAGEALVGMRGNDTLNGLGGRDYLEGGPGARDNCTEGIEYVWCENQGRGIIVPPPPEDDSYASTA